MSLPRDRVRVVRRQLADGTVKEYTYKRDRTKPRKSRFADQSIGALIIAYRQSPEWLRLKDNTRAEATRYLQHIEKFPHYPVSDITRRSILSIRNGMATRGASAAANRFVQTIQRLLNWAVDNDWLTVSPIVRIKQLPGGHLETWTRAEADFAAKNLPLFLQRVVILGRYTGQRRGDLVKMRWSDYDGSRIQVMQQKGAGKHNRPALLIPAHPVLKTHLDAWKREATSTHILTGAQGRPMNAHAMSTMLGRNLLAIGMRDELNSHGLRKLAATEMADAGCTAHEIAAVTGHQTLAMVQLYTVAANQEKLAQAAVTKLDDARKKRGDRG